MFQLTGAIPDTDALEDMLPAGWVPMPGGGCRHIAVQSDPDRSTFLEEDLE
jgi:hypothetical protein